jgi:L-lactate dehydrogenase complex protein LldE
MSESLPKKQVALLVTCLVDQALPDVGISTVNVLRRAGYDVVFPPAQTCCGQPYFNSGFQKEAKRLARRTIDIFVDFEAVVLPSGSCTAMICKEYPHLFANELNYYYRALRLAKKNFELSAFLSRAGKLPTAAKQTAVSPSTTVTYHDSCHMCRLLGLRDEPRQALEASGYTINEMAESDRCCGFGGLFSVRMPEVSNAMTAEKLRQAKASKASTMITADPGCLMQMRGMLRDDDDLQIEHIATMLDRGGQK